MLSCDILPLTCQEAIGYRYQFTLVIVTAAAAFHWFFAIQPSRSSFIFRRGNIVIFRPLKSNHTNTQMPTLISLSKTCHTPHIDILLLIGLPAFHYDAAMLIGFHYSSHTTYYFMLYLFHHFLQRITCQRY